MNTTEVLQCAYPSSQTLSDRQRINEERYGGPVRSSEEMYNIYTRFYQAPLNNQHSHYAGQEVSRKKIQISCSVIEFGFFFFKYLDCFIVELLGNTLRKRMALKLKHNLSSS